jgi:hypothetical protein
MSWKDVVKSVAPVLGTALGGPLAGAAIKTLSAKFLGTDEGDLQDLETQLENQFLSASPDALIELRKLDKEFEAKMAELKVDVFKIETRDRQNARKENKQSIMPAALSVGLSVTIIVIVYLLFYVTVPTGSKEVLFMLLGVVMKEWGGSMQYWFGTTRSSAEKTAMMINGSNK